MMKTPCGMSKGMVRGSLGLFVHDWYMC